jgi:hypothetical protein
MPVDLLDRLGKAHRDRAHVVESRHPLSLPTERRPRQTPVCEPSR